MDWVLYLLLLALLLVGLFINILGLPGLWLMVGSTALYAWVTAGQYASWRTLLALLILGLLAELVEFLAGAAGSKAAGGTKRGMAGAIAGGIVGGIVGTPLLPIIGTVLGACLGSFIGAFAVELTIGRGAGLATRIGWGAAKGRFFGIIAKSVFGLVMLIVALWMSMPIAPSPPTIPPPLPGIAPEASDDAMVE